MVKVLEFGDSEPVLGALKEAVPLGNGADKPALGKAQAFKKES